MMPKPITTLVALTLCAPGVVALSQDSTTQQSAQARVQQIQQQAQQQQQDQVDRLKRGVVRVTAQKKGGGDPDAGVDKGSNPSSESGTGIVLSSTPHSALILTALHVVNGASSISVNFYTGQMKAYPAHKLLKHSSEMDLAVLEVDFTAGFEAPAEMPSYNFAANNTLRALEHVYSVNGEWSVVPNSITNLSSEGDPQKFEYSNVSVGKGFSGGPVFDEYGDVVGIHLARSRDDSYGIADKIDSALQVLEALGYTVPKAGPIVIPNYATPLSGNVSVAGGGSGRAPASHTRAPSNSAEPCANGCTATFADLQHVAQYKSQGIGACVEGVYAFPKGWPGENLFLHASYCPGLSGSVSHAVRIRMAATSRAGDQDMTLGLATLAGSTGQGFINTNNGRWKLSLQNPDYGSAVNLNLITLTIQPF